MKYLVLLKQRPVAGPLDPNMAIALNEATKAWIKAELAAGRIDSAYNVIPNTEGFVGAGICAADSPEALNRQLTSYPAVLTTEFVVYPLSEVNAAIDDYTGAFKRMGGG